MNIEASTKNGSRDLITIINNDTHAAVAYWIGMLIGLGVLMFWLFARGPDHPVCALILTLWTFLLTPGLAVPVLKRLPSSWHRVPSGERLVHQMLGVSIFGRLLERSGWNRRNVYPAWEFSITRTRLPLRALAARGGMGAHGACFAIHMLFAALAVFTGHPWGALWMLLPGVIVHLYPVLLQRSIMLRLQPLLDKCARTF